MGYLFTVKYSKHLHVHVYQQLHSMFVCAGVCVGVCVRKCDGMCVCVCVSVGRSSDQGGRWSAGGYKGVSGGEPAQVEPAPGQLHQVCWGTLQLPAHRVQCRLQGSLPHATVRQQSRW